MVLEQINGLAAAVLIHAVRDARSRDPLVALDAILFLTGDAAIWLEGMSIRADPLTVITSKHLRRSMGFLKWLRKK